MTLKQARENDNSVALIQCDRDCYSARSAIRELKSSLKENNKKLSDIFKKNKDGSSRRNGATEQ